MGPRYLLLTLAILFASVVTASVVSNTKIDGYVFGRRNSAKRLLRASNEAEERVIPGLNVIKGAIKSGVDAIKLRSWLAKKKSPEDIFGKLELYWGVEDAIASPQLRTFGKYVKMFSKKYPESEVTVLGVLTVHYGESTVAKALVDMKNVESTKATATNLQTQQFQGWLDSGKTPKDVFEILKVRDMNRLFVNSRAMDVLEGYILKFNEKNPQLKKDLMQTLQDGFRSESRYAIVVALAAQSGVTEEKAVPYQTKLFSQWWDRKLDPTSVLVKVLNVDENNVAAASDLKKMVVKQYSEYHNKRAGITLEAVEPRRS